MKMKLSALSMAIAAAGLAATVAQAADVALFPYVVNSPTVTTLVTIVDQGGNNVGYDSSGNTPGGRLHWRLHYKAGANATNNTAFCDEVNYYLPSSPNDIQTVDLGGVFGANTKGVLFNDASINNNWNAGTTATINYMLGKAAGATQRGVLFVHNAENTPAQTLYGEAMIIDFSTGAAWGYQALLRDNGGSNDQTAFDFSAQATNAFGSPPDIVTFMPTNETTTRIFVTPVNSGGSMLGANGASIAGWDRLNARVTLQTGTGVAFDRDENLVSGSVQHNVVCVGAVDVTQMMTSGAAAVLANGGWGTLAISPGNVNGAAPTGLAVATKLEFNTTGKLNGQAIPGTFNNGFIMR
jgi:hypothetical protein